MLFHFINVLLQVLLHKSHDLLQEEITVAIYNMASVDFDAFYSAFMPEFLNGCQGVDTNQRAVLARNFKLERVTVISWIKHHNRRFYEYMKLLQSPLTSHLITLDQISSWIHQLMLSLCSRTCLPSLKVCSGWWTTFATTDYVTVVCPLVPLSYSTPTAWTVVITKTACDDHVSPHSSSSASIRLFK